MLIVVKHDLNVDELTFVPQYVMGVASNMVNVYNVQNRLIGTVEAMNVPRFAAGEASVFNPVENWKMSFSQKLKVALGLVPEQMDKGRICASR
jgi:hypothetical protein